MRATFVLANAAVLLLLLLQFTSVTAEVSEDEQMMGWQNFNMKVTDASVDAVIRSFVGSNKMMIANENNLGYPEDIIVAPEHVEDFKALLSEHSVEFTIPNQDVGAMLLKERLENLAQSYQTFNDPSTYFAQTPQIYSWLSSLVRANSGIASLQKIGSSYEKRDLWVLRLSRNRAANRPIIFLDSAIHAREWLAPATLNFIIRSLIADWNKADVKALLDKYDFYCMPVVNPDGYDYTFRSSSTRFWRKTRQPYRVFYYGADPNRNFDFEFGGPGTSNNPGSDIYHGPRPFSEPETLALSQFLTGVKSRLAKGMYISFHTYGQMWLTPPGYTRRLPSDHSDMMKIANIGMNAIKSAGGPEFRVGQPANIGLYEAAGGSYDWVKYVLGVKYSYTLELRPAWPAGLNGFAPSVSAIAPSGKETYAAIKAVAAADRT